MKKILKRLSGRFPTALPLWSDDFKAWAQDICHTYNLPDAPASYEKIGVMIMHLGQNTTHKPKRFFAQCVKKQLANEAAYGHLELLKAQAKSK